jgi:ribose transport system permease protein
MNRTLSRNAWTLGLGLLLVLLLVATKVIQPQFGASGLESLARAAVPFAFATAAMAIVVIAGGIDLSVAAVMAVASVSAAVLMERFPDLGLAIVPLAIVIGAGMGLLNGAMIVLTRLPDIVVTLAMLFVWEGVALLVLKAPGGAAYPWLMDVLTGDILVPILPQAVVVVALCLLPFWWVMARTRLGLSIRAIGSDPVAAFRSGVPIGATRIAAYGLAGCLAGLGGLSLTLSTGIGEPIPGPYLLAAVAAVVLGGVALSGGKGGLIGPIIAVVILRLVRLMLALMAVDPNVTAIVEGTIMVAVVMFGGFIALRGART